MTDKETLSAQSSPDQINFQTLPDAESLEQYKKIDPDLPKQIATTTLQNVNTQTRLETQRAATDKIVRIITVTGTTLVALAGVIMAGILVLFSRRSGFQPAVIAIASILPLLFYLFWSRKK